MLCKELDSVLEAQEQKANQLYNETRTRGKTIREGDLVMLLKGYQENEQALATKLLPKAEGPYLVLEMPTPQNVILGHPGNKQPIDRCKNHSTIAADRCVFFPVKLEHLVEEPRSPEFSALEKLQPNQVLALNTQHQDVYLGVICSNFPERACVLIKPMTPENRTARQFKDKVWKETTTTLLVGYVQCLGVVELNEARQLTDESCEQLRILGVIM